LTPLSKTIHYEIDEIVHVFSKEISNPKDREKNTQNSEPEILKKREREHTPDSSTDSDSNSPNAFFELPINGALHYRDNSSSVEGESIEEVMNNIASATSTNPKLANPLKSSKEKITLFKPSKAYYDDNRIDDELATAFLCSLFSIPLFFIEPISAAILLFCAILLLGAAIYQHNKNLEVNLVM
jgi:hypothetical protein